MQLQGKKLARQSKTTLAIALSSPRGTWPISSTFAFRPLLQGT